MSGQSSRYSHRAIRRTLSATLVAAALLASTAHSARAASCGSTPPDTLLVLDHSGSMASRSGTYTKWLSAVNAVNQLLLGFNGQLAFGLMLFPGDGLLSGFCGTGKVKVATSTTSASAILAALKKAGTPTGGGTPLGKSLDAARKYLLGLGTKTPKNIIVVTDGGESCGGNPAQEAASLKAVGITTYVIGFNAAVAGSTLQQIAQAGGSGRYYSASSLSQLSSALKQIAGSLTCCGNGKLDTGETCDTKIAGGSGSCPATCTDDNPCTKDTLVGSGCSAKCVHTNTCIKQCGNRVVEPGEFCDKSIAAGVKGACPTRCTSSDRCVVSTLEGKGCQAHCVTRAATADPKKKDGCCPKGMSQKDDADCKPLCGPDDSGKTNCIDLCRSVSCGAGKVCQQGKCVAGGGSTASGSNRAGASGRQRPRTGHYVGGCSLAADERADGEGPLSSFALLCGLALWLRLGARRRRR